MGAPLKFTLQMVDQISGPAARAAGGLSRVDGALAKTLSKANMVSGAAAEAAASAQHHARSTSGLASNLASSLGGMAGMGAMALGGLAVAGAGAAVMGGRWAMNAAVFRAESIKALELIEGSAAKAKETYDRIDAIGDTTPFSGQAVMNAFKTLRGAGFQQDRAEKVFLALSDIASVQGENRDQAMASLMDAVTKINATGKLTGEVLETVDVGGKNAGVTRKSLFEQLAKQRGQTIDQVQEAISRGQIDGESAINALMAAAVAQVNNGGELGTATKQFGLNTIAGQVASLGNAFERMTKRINVDAFVEVMKRLNAMLSEDNTKAMTAWVGQAFDWIAAAMDKALTAGSKFIEGVSAGFAPFAAALSQGVESGITFESVLAVVAQAGTYVGAALGLIGAAAQWAYPIVEEAFLAMWGGIALSLPGLQLMWTALNDLFAAWGLGEGKASTFGQSLIFIWSATGWLITGVIDLVAALVWAMARFAEFEGWVRGTFINIGSAIVQGIWTGVTSYWGWLLEQLSGLAELLPESVKKVLGIASPSKVFATEVGEQLPAGIEVGAMDGMDRLQNVYRAMLPGEQARPGAGAPAAAAGGAASVGPITVTIYDARDAKETADRVVDEIERRLLRRMELGAAMAGAM